MGRLRPDHQSRLSPQRSRIAATERATGLGPAVSTLARWRFTN